MEAFGAVEFAILGAFRVIDLETDAGGTLAPGLVDLVLCDVISCVLGRRPAAIATSMSRRSIG